MSENERTQATIDNLAFQVMCTQAGMIAQETAHVLQDKCKLASGDHVNIELLVMAALRLSAVITAMAVENSEEGIHLAVRSFESELRIAIKNIYGKS